MQNGDGYFNSASFGKLGFEQTVRKVLAVLQKDPVGIFKIIVGTDSEEQNGGADFVSAIVLHHVGHGGIYFWQRQVVQKKMVLRQRIYQEAVFSLLLSQKLVDKFAELKFYKYNLEIHVDVGTKGDTREMINEVVGMVRGSGFAVKTKPEAFGASNVADRHT